MQKERAMDEWERGRLWERVAENHEISLGRDTWQGIAYEAAAKVSQAFDPECRFPFSVYMERWQERVQN